MKSPPTFTAVAVAGGLKNPADSVVELSSVMNASVPAVTVRVPKFVESRASMSPMMTSVPATNSALPPTLMVVPVGMVSVTEPAVASM